ncbi:MAG: PD40 domain-containing protein [Acidobacteria bacterium]|nr:PD40 domain-containing protein [Acidobacteriota bacterium]
MLTGGPEIPGERVIETIPAAGGTPVVFAGEGNTNWNPVWSPDGTHLYFASDRRGNMAFYRAEINLITGLPLTEAQLVPTPGRYNRHIAFSADGRRMAYVQTSNRSNIKRLDLNPETGKAIAGPSWVTRGDFEFSNIDISPDGKRIYARLIRKSQDDIVAVAADTGNIQDLTNDLPFDRYPRVSPDGSRVIFVSDRSGTYQLWIMSSDGTGLRQLTPDSDGTASIPSWSPDGKRITYDNERTTFLAELNDSFEMVNVTPLPLTENGGWFRVWSWSPDGKYLGGNFDSAHGPGMGYYDIAARKYHRVIDFPAFPSWLSDSRRMIFIRDRKPVMADITTGEVREVFPEIAEDIRNIKVSSDGRTVFYSTHENESDIWMLDLADE